MRAFAVRQLMAQDRRLRIAHPYENRLQTVIRNIRLINKIPALDDYHYILKQFASVGYHTGAIQVYKEILRVGHQPDGLTFAYCLQALAYRLTLPVPRKERAIRSAECRTMLDELLVSMRDRNIPFSAINLEMVIRVMKDTVDAEGFASLMRTCYGIDLSNPDCVPLEFTETASKNPHLPLPFTTTALNTTIDVLGRLGNVSKMVQAFEVLTNPLPGAQSHINSSFDDDGEEDFGVASVTSNKPEFIPPHASPNTTTYNILLRHLCQAEHAVLARHYLLMAFSLDRATSSETIKRVYQMQTRDVPAPHFAINRTTLTPLLGTGNRNKDLGLLRWLQSKLSRHVRLTKANLTFFANFRSGLVKFSIWPYGERQSLSVPQSPSQASEIPPPRPATALHRLGSVSQRVPIQMTKPTDVLDLDISKQTPIPSSEPAKKLDINLHIAILERNLQEISQFRGRIDNTLSRTTERVKERLGRRVWAGRDVYLRTEAKRVNLSQKKWTDIVNFKPRLEYEAPPRNVRDRPPHEGYRPTVR